MTRVDEIKQLLGQCTLEERLEIFGHLRIDFSIHEIEKELNTTAEVILAAIARSNDLIKRGIRGVIAEAAFETYVLNDLQGWEKISFQGDEPYDYLIRDSNGELRIQVKMQRLKDQKPMTANQAYRRLPTDMYVVETQRTRGGKDTMTGEDTRPYRYGEFDILAVSMYPSTKKWDSFMYTVATWLIPRPENTKLMLKFQPVSLKSDDNWTSNFETCVAWFRSGQKKKLL